ncbi:carboxymuconolactone decarboxylase family protein [Nocardia abscessus]|uniref:carboxymuconolactone decarboxylase family protein n=1 Tax=Nocardia abscessus TaxID=120957 RepID=UPI002457E459|nr:carboxymuconolactone decarboxylase family protein [Nocardia abscessus]
MRLDILDRGYGTGTKLLFTLIRVVSGQPVPDAAKLVFYRPDFYGARAKKFTHEAMRGRSTWSVADRELMAAFVSKVNGCTFCVDAHTATAGRRTRMVRRFGRCWPTWNRPPSRTGCGRTLRMLGKLTREGMVGVEDMREVLSAGVTRRQVEDALAVCAAFNTTDRLADAFGFELLSPAGFEAGAEYLLKWGYR